MPQLRGPARPGWITGHAQLVALDARFARMAVIAPHIMHTVTARSARRIEKAWARKWTRGPQSRIKSMPFSIRSSVAFTNVGVVAEIYSDTSNKKQQGSFAHLIEYGSIRNAPLPGAGPALAAEVPRFEAEMRAALAHLLGP
jgi:hypothetical protein